MRIMLVSDFYPPSPGGMESHVQRLAHSLGARGHDIAVVSSTVDAEPLQSGVRPKTVSTLLARIPGVFQDQSRAYPPPWPDPIFRRELRHLVNEWRPDVVHAHGWCSFSCHWPASPPLVVTLHDHGLRCPEKSLLTGAAECTSGLGKACWTCQGTQPISKRVPLAATLSRSVPGLVRHTKRFIAVSRSVAERVSEVGVPLTNIEVIPNFITEEVRRSRCSDQSSTESQRMNGILFVGPTAVYKGRSVAVDAFRQLPRELAELRLVGSREAIHESGIINLGYLHGDAIRSEYRRASMVIVPSVWPEPCPTVVLEAMVNGKPVIGSRIGGIPDLVDHGRTGLLVPPNDPTALAESMLRVITDAELRRRLGEGAQVRVRRFLDAAIVPRLEAVYGHVSERSAS